MIKEKPLKKGTKEFLKTSSVKIKKTVQITFKKLFVQSQ